MKKIYLMLFLLTSYTGMAQTQRLANLPNVELENDAHVESEASKKSAAPEAQLKTSGTAAVVFSEDFSNGFSGQGTNGAWSTSGSATNATWEYRGPNTTPNATVGSRGGFAGTQLPILSPTASNGFMIFDSNYLDDNGTAGAYGTGLAPTPHTSYLTSPTINLTGYAPGQLVFSFTHYFRRNQGLASIHASIDNGATWNNIYDITGVQSNIATARDAKVEFIVPNSVVGNANVKFRFQFDVRYYFWMIDDIQLIETLPNDLIIMSMPRPRIFFDQTELWGQYYQVPTAFSTPINFDMSVINFGSEDQPGTKVTADIIDLSNGATAQTAQSTPLLLASGIDSLIDVITPSALQPGSHTNYKVMFTASSDSTDNSPADNIDSLFFSITDSVFARDNGTMPGTLSNGGFVNYDGALAHTYFQRYDTRSAASNGYFVNSISVRVSVSTDTLSGIYLVPMLLDTNYDPSTPITDVNDFNYWKFVDHLPPNNTNPANGPVGRWWTLPVRKTNGTKYILSSADEEVGAAIQINGGTQTNRVYIGIDNTAQVSQASLLAVDGGLVGLGTRNLAIRLNVGAINPANKAELEAAIAGLRLLQNAPNPFSDMTRITYEMDLPMNNVSLQIYDMAGREVFSKYQDNQSAGEYTVDFNATGLESGIYFYKLITDKAVVTKKMVLNR